MTRRTLLILVAIGLVTAGLGARQGQDRLTTDLLKGIELRSIGPALTTGRIVDVEIDPKNPSVWYVVLGVRRPLEDDEPRHHLLADLRRQRRLHALLRRHRSEGLERPLARHGREQQPAQRAFRRRHLQVHRRRQDVEAHGPRDLRTHRRRRSSTPATRTSSTWRRRGRSSPRAASAGSTRRPTAEPPGLRS